MKLFSYSPPNLVIDRRKTCSLTSGTPLWIQLLAMTIVIRVAMRRHAIYAHLVQLIKICRTCAPAIANMSGAAPSKESSHRRPISMITLYRKCQSEIKSQLNGIGLSARRIQIGVKAGSFLISHSGRNE